MTPVSKQQMKALVFLCSIMGETLSTIGLNIAAHFCKTVVTHPLKRITVFFFYNFLFLCARAREREMHTERIGSMPRTIGSMNVSAFLHFGILKFQMSKYFVVEGCKI